MGEDKQKDYRKLDGDQLPLLSIVVPFRLGESAVLQCLDSIYSMSYPGERLDVIIIDDWHDDEISAGIRSAFPETRIFQNAQTLGCDAAKEIGIKAAAGDIIALTDADCRVDHNWGRTIAEALSGETSIVTGPVSHERRFLHELICISDFPFSQSREYHLTDSFPGCNFAAHRRVFESVGFKYNVTSELRGGSDRLLSWHLYSMGERIAYDPRMVVFHKPAVDCRRILARRRMYGSTAYMMRKIDPTLPGSAIARIGPLAGLAYICYKSYMDIARFPRLVKAGVAPLWHVPLLLPCLFTFHLLDAVSITAQQLKRSSVQTPETWSRSREDKLRATDSYDRLR
ncbi:MAG TPA: glycosyltransferase [Armatimonadota bacterium]|jgi:glycosyltransferase involved in cell wall biosynthesis